MTGDLEQWGFWKGGAGNMVRVGSREIMRGENWRQRV